MYSVIDFDVMGDDRGSLVALEGCVHIPFDIKRVFYVYGTEGEVSRGDHANRKTQFVLISVSGECKVTIRTPTESTVIKLDSPHKGLFLDRMTWKEMHDFARDSVLLVLCSENYDQSEYIYDFDKFVGECDRG